MKYLYCCCLIIGQWLSHSAYGQLYSSTFTEPDILWEAGFAAGAINCLTDIGGSNSTGKRFIRDINWSQTKFTGSVFVSATWQYLFALRLQAMMGRISGTDQLLQNSEGAARNRYLRNLQFGTSVAELSLLAELHPLTILDKNKEAPHYSPYLLAGVGWLHYNPQALVNNTWVDLRPLHTEGEGFKEYPERKVYRPWTWCLPIGAGIKYDAGGLLNARFEMLYRFTGTDYLDDASTRYIEPALFSKYLSPQLAAQAAPLADRGAVITGGTQHQPNDIRGNPNNRDAYFSCTLSVSLVIERLHRR